MKICPKCGEFFTLDTNKHKCRKYIRQNTKHKPLRTLIREQAYLYLIHSPINGYLKIGISSNPKVRLQSMQCGSPVPLLLINSWGIPENKLINFENLVHVRLDYCRRHGEWFECEMHVAVEIILKTLLELWDSQIKECCPIK